MKIKYKSIFKFICLAAAILISCCIIIFAALYFFRSNIQKYAFNLIEKKLELRRFEISGINFYSIKHFSVARIVFDKDDNLNLEITDFDIELKNFKNLYERINLTNLSIKSLTLNFNFFEETVDTTPINLKELIVLPQLQYFVNIDNISLTNLNIIYNDTLQQININNAMLTGNFLYDGFKPFVKSELKYFSKQTNYKFDVYQSYFNALDLNAKINCDTEKYNFDLNAKTLFSFHEKMLNINIPAVSSNIKSTFSIQPQQQKMNISINAEAADILKTNFKIKIDYDTFIEKTILTLDKTFIDINPLAAANKNFGSDNFILPAIRFQTFDNILISHNFNNNELSLKNINCAIDIKNLNYSDTLINLANCGIAAKISADALINDFNILPSNIFFNYNFSAEILSYDNLINIRNIQSYGNINKKNADDINNWIVADTNILFSKAGITNIFNSIDTYSFSLLAEDINIAENYNLKKSNFLFDGIKAAQKFSVKTKITAFNFAFDEIDIFKIPQITIETNGQISELNSIKINATIQSEKFINFNTGIYFENNDDYVKLLLADNIDFQKLYDNSYFQSDNLQLNLNLEKLKNIYNLPQLNSLTGIVDLSTRLKKTTNSLPKITADLKINNVNFNDTALNFNIRDFSFNFAIKDFIPAFEYYKNSTTDYYINNPLLDRNSNLFIKNISWNNINVSNISGNIGLSNSLFYINNLNFDLLDGAGSLNASANLISRNFMMNAKLNNINISKLSDIPDINKRAGYITALCDLKISDLFNKNKLIDFNNINAVLNAKVNKDALFSLLAIVDPTAQYLDTARLKTILKFAAPTSGKITLNSGMLNSQIVFDSKLIKDFRVERIQLNKMKMLK